MLALSGLSKAIPPLVAIHFAANSSSAREGKPHERASWADFQDRLRKMGRSPLEVVAAAVNKKGNMKRGSMNDFYPCVTDGFEGYGVRTRIGTGFRWQTPRAKHVDVVDPKYPLRDEATAGVPVVELRLKNGRTCEVLRRLPGDTFLSPLSRFSRRMRHPEKLLGDQTSRKEVSLSKEMMANKILGLIYRSHFPGRSLLKPERINDTMQLLSDEPQRFLDVFFDKARLADPLGSALFGAGRNIPYLPQLVKQGLMATRQHFTDCLAVLKCFAEKPAQAYVTLGRQFQTLRREGYAPDMLHLGNLIDMPRGEIGLIDPLSYDVLRMKSSDPNASDFSRQRYGGALARTASEDLRRLVSSDDWDFGVAPQAGEAKAVLAAFHTKVERAIKEAKLT